MLRAGSTFDVKHLADEWLLAGWLNGDQIADLDGHKDRVHGGLASGSIDSSSVLAPQGASPDWRYVLKRRFSSQGETHCSDRCSYNSAYGLSEQ